MDNKVINEPPLPLSMKTLSDWVCALIGLFSGGIAYFNQPLFLEISTSELLKRAGEMLWAVSIAGITTLTGLIVKHWFDVKGKTILNKWFLKKKKKE